MLLLREAAWKVCNTLQLIFTLASSAGCISLALVTRVITGSPRLPLLWAGRLWAPLLLGGAGARLEVHGRDRVDWNRPMVIVANHQSIIDICVLFRTIPVPVRFILKQELRRMPLVGRYAQAMGMVFIDRSAGRGTASSLARATELLGQGAVLAAFPEGTRSATGVVGRFKPGVFQAALDAGATVVPVAIEGAGRVLPPGDFQVRPGTIRVTFGEPLRPEDPGPTDRAAMAALARQRIVALLPAR